MPTRQELMVALRNADAAGDEQAARAIVRMMDAAPPEGGPTPNLPAPAPTARAGAGGPRAAAPASGTGPHLPGPPEGAGAVADVPGFRGVRGKVRGVEGLVKTPKQKELDKQMFWSLGLPSYQSMEVDPETGGNRAQNVVAGVGQSLMSTGGGIRQLWNQMTGDEEEYARLLQEEEENRKIDEKLLDNAWGRGGQIGGHVAQWLVPAGEVAKGASALGKAMKLKRTLPLIVGSESLLGGAAGTTQPVTEDESRLANAKSGAIWGGAIPVGGRLLKPVADVAKRSAGAMAWAAKNMTPLAVVKVAEALHMPYKQAKEMFQSAKESEAAKVAAEVLGKAKTEGQEAVSRIHRAVEVPHAALGRALREHVGEWGRDVPDVVKNKISKLLGDDIPRPQGQKPVLPEKPKPIKQPKEEVAKPAKKETEGQKIKRLQAENNAREMARLERQAEEAARKIAAMRPKAGDAGKLPGEVKTTYPNGGGPAAAGAKRVVPKPALRAMVKGLRSKVTDEFLDPLEVMAGTRSAAATGGKRLPAAFDASRATPEAKRMMRQSMKDNAAEYAEARAASASKPRLPADKPKPAPAPPRVSHGPSEGPRIKGSDLDDLLTILRSDTSKGVKGEGVQRLIGTIEDHLGRGLSDTERASLNAARARALKGDPAKLPEFLIKPSVKRQVIRSAIETRQRD